MSALTGNQIKTSYNGLLKTVDNAALPALGGKTITDGEGNTTGVSIGQDYVAIDAAGQLYYSDNLIIADAAQANGIYTDGNNKVNYAGNHDFTGATVTGIGGGGGFVGVADTTMAALTTTGADLTYKSILIPANTFAAGDVLSFRALLEMDLSNGGWIYWSAWIHTTTAPITGFGKGGGATSNGTPNTASYDQLLVVHTTDGSGSGTSSITGNAVDQWSPDGLNQYNDNGAQAINWTVDQYINFVAYIDNAGNSITFNGGYLKKEN